MTPFFVLSLPHRETVESHLGMSPCMERCPSWSHGDFPVIRRCHTITMAAEDQSAEKSSVPSHHPTTYLASDGMLVDLNTTFTVLHP
jgi:hypothetical protein